MSVFVSNNANGRNVSFSSFESSIVDDTQIRTKKKMHQCGGGLNQNNLQNRRNFLAPLRRTEVNARRARSASDVRVEEKRNNNYFAHVSRTSSSPRAHLAFASVLLKNMKKNTPVLYARTKAKSKAISRIQTPTCFSFLVRCSNITLNYQQ